MVNWQSPKKHQPEEKATIRKDCTEKLSIVIEINNSQTQDHSDHLGHLVRGTVEYTINAMLNTEADALATLAMHEHSEAYEGSRAVYY